MDPAETVLPITHDAPAPAQPAFYYDLGDPDCYLVAERILGELPVLAEWMPVHGARLGWTPPPVEYDELARRVADLGLQPLRLPPRWPPDSELAMLACAFAKGGGRTVAFSLAAFRQQFAGGRDIADESTVLIAAAACEMHPRSVLKAVQMRSVADSLRRRTEAARAAGVTRLPAIVSGEQVFEGPDVLEQAAAALSEAAV